MQRYNEIEQLCAEAGLETAHYRVFERRSTENPPADAEPMRPDPATAPERSAGVRVTGQRGVVGGVANADRAVTARPSYHWDQLGGSDRSDCKTREAGAASAARSVVVASVAGGAGATTVVASLARTLSASERVALVEPADEPLLPYYFGASQAAGAMRVMLPGLPGERGAMDVFARTDDSADTREEWTRKTTVSVAARYDRVLVDMGRASTAEIAGCDASLLVLVATADVNSAVRLGSLGPLLRERGARATLLLNKFAPELPLHQSFLKHLEERFGEWLLPVRVRYSSAAPEAVASGRTLLDFAPESEAAQDFVRLAAWLSAYRGAR